MAPKQAVEQSAPKQRYEAPELVAIETSATKVGAGTPSDFAFGSTVS